jgi:hypothetical protein
MPRQQVFANSAKKNSPPDPILTGGRQTLLFQGGPAGPGKTVIVAEFALGSKGNRLIASIAINNTSFAANPSRARSPRSKTIPIHMNRKKSSLAWNAKEDFYDRNSSVGEE